MANRLRVADGSLQRAFLSAVLGGSGAERFPLLRGEFTTDERLRIYRNNIVSGLTDALRNSYPLVAASLGRVRFAALVRAYLECHPPLTGCLLDFGAELPSFLPVYAPTRARPWLADVARFERHWQECVHAEDRACLDVRDLARMPVSADDAVRLIPHPATRWMRSPHPVLEIWRGGATIAGFGENSGLDADTWRGVIIVRQQREVVVEVASGAEVEMLDRFALGDTVEEAGQAALRIEADFDLAAGLYRLLSLGCFCEVSIDQREEIAR